ncbi:MAG: hypothetical protein JW724_06225, partial [Candidatus Altiarchaeota archaeon]|nr:hypothetical protein [Candidatus Altiarchaeota archaeon]
YSVELEYNGATVDETYFDVLSPGVDVCIDCKPKITTTTTSASLSSAATKTVTTSISSSVYTATTGIFYEPITSITTPTYKLAVEGEKIDIGARKEIFSPTEEPEFELRIVKGEELAGTKAVTPTETINAHVEDVHGTLIGIEPEIKKIGSTNLIKIPKTRKIKAGLYKLVVEYQGEVDEQWFTWGLLSVNTKKSTYKPGETADIIIIALDKEGHPVCGADISLEIKRPDERTTTYSTSDDTIHTGEECGIYETGYTTEIEGNHTIKAFANADGLKSSFETYFLTKEEYEFDIIRNAESKIDPTEEDRFYVSIEIKPQMDAGNMTIREYLPKEFDINDTDAEVTEDGDTKILTWKGKGNTTIYYYFRVPPLWPYLYRLGPIDIHYGDASVFTESRPWFLAVDPALWPGAGLWPQTCTAESQSTGSGTWDTSCTGSYPAACPTDRVSCTDSTSEEQQTKSSRYAGVRLSYYNTTITNCAGITNVWVCYKWWTSRADTTVCDISVDNDGDASWSSVDLNCPGTTEPAALTCVDATSKDGADWTCQNFFGPSGTRAELKSEALSIKNALTTVYWDVLFYNVTYVSAGYLNSTLHNPVPAETLNNHTNETFRLNATVSCKGNPGDSCGIVSGTVRYNASSIHPDTVIITIPETKPFHADLESISCGVLSYGENCTLNWTINATQEGRWIVDVNFSSAYSVIAPNNTGNATVNVSLHPVLAVNLTYPLTDPLITEEETFELNCTVNATGSKSRDVIVYAVYCTGSECEPNQKLNTTSTGLRADIDSVGLGTVYTTDAKNASFNITGLATGNYVIACNATSSNAGNVSSLPVNTSLHVNDPPEAVWDYPLEDDFLHGVEELNATGSSDSDG